MTEPDSPEPAPRPKRTRKNNHKFVLEGRPGVRLALIRELALGEVTHAQLGVKYQVSRDSITAFKKRHEQEIADCLAKADSEFKGILIADKANRLSAYEKMLMDAMDSGDRRSAIRILRNVAEEMGHLPSRMQISGAVDVHTSYTVTGADGSPVDMSRLT